LDEYSRSIISILAHCPEITNVHIAKLIGLSKAKSQSLLESLIQFGTIYQSAKGKFKIQGTLIELYGKRFIPFEKKCKINFLVPVIRYVIVMLCLIILGKLYFYTHPSKVSQNFQFSSGVISLDLPKTMEADETGKIMISVKNSGQKQIDTLLISLNSEIIRFDNNGSSLISFFNIYPNTTQNSQIDYWVRPTNEKELFSAVKVLRASESFEFKIHKRSFPTRRFSDFMSTILAVLALLLPWKSWKDIFAALSEILKKIIQRSN